MLNRSDSEGSGRGDGDFAGSGRGLPGAVKEGANVDKALASLVTVVT